MNLRAAARDQLCQLRLLSICNGDPATSVLAHIRRAGNAGTGMKPPDVSGIVCCSACHDVLDGRAGNLRAHDSDILDGLLRTHDLWRRLGLLR